MPGTLYLCGTPIGNLGDMSPRAVEALRAADLIAAEDTRRSAALLNHFEIKTPMTSYHKYNHRSKGAYLIQKLLSGENIALVTDAGMPGISDPGEELVRLCMESGIVVTAVPGPTALTLALVLSGFSGRRFVFEGFLPREKSEREEVLSSLKEETRTVIFYEAPHRLARTLETLHKTVGDRSAACVRELTKVFEEVRRGKLSELLEFYAGKEPKGEFVVVLEGLGRESVKKRREEGFAELSVTDHMKLYAELPEKDAMKAVAKDRGVSKREIYAELKK